MTSVATIDCIPDFAPGPLDAYRNQATFNWKVMRLFLEKPRELKIKMEIWDTLEKDSLFQHSNDRLSSEEEKRLTALRVNKFIKYNFLRRNTSNMSYAEKTKQLMTVNEALFVLFPDVSVKIALGYSLFTNALLSIGTERHQYYHRLVWDGHMFAAFALTEVAHGSNTKNMQTTATYDPSTQEYIINTPNFESAKCYVGNLGKTCTIVLLLAQLYTENECKGLHVFLVPVRDPKTLLPYPGIVVGDMGEKNGLHGIDNGFMMFNNYRIPREYLMNRTGDVTVEGVYESSFNDPGRILGAALQMLSAARVGIIQENTCTIASAVTIAIRYAALRRQFGSTDNEEVPIIEYPLHQWRLFPYVAASYVFKLSTSVLTDIYIGTVEKSNNGDKLNHLSEMVSEVHAMVSSAKPLMTWTCRDAIQECREACGGFGYLKSARLGDMRNNQDPSVTYEGDNNVLVQQTSKWLLRQWNLRHSNGDNIISPIGTCTFFKSGDEILKRQFTAGNIEDINNIQFILDCYQWLICWLSSETNNMLEEYSKQGTCNFTAKNHVKVYRTSILSKAYGENLVLTCYWNEIQKHSQDNAIFTVLEQFGKLYGLWCLDKHLIYFYEGRYTSGPKLAKFVKESILKLCSDLKPNIVAAIDSLAPPDFVLNSVLGKSDGKLYQNLQMEFFHNEGNLSRPTWWKEIVNPNAPDIRRFMKSKL